MLDKPRKHSTILIVEDDPLVRLDIVLAFSDAGFAVIEAGDAHEALDVLESRDGLALVFTDIEMPGTIDGLDLARIVAERWPEIGVLVTSGRMQPKTLPRGQFVPKPYDNRAIVSRARRLAA